MTPSAKSLTAVGCTRGAGVSRAQLPDFREHAVLERVSQVDGSNDAEGQSSLLVGSE